MITASSIADAVWTASTRTLAGGSPSAATTLAQKYAAAVWTHSTRTLTNPPGAITDLNATAVSSSQVNLTWTPATNATSHRIERSLV